MSPTLRTALRMVPSAGYHAAVVHLCRRGRYRELFAVKLPARDQRWGKACRLRHELQQVVLGVAAVRCERRGLVNRE